MSAPELPPVPARMLNEFVYCPRLFYLEWIYGEWEENVHTLEGTAVHSRVDKEEGRLPLPEEIEKEDT